MMSVELIKLMTNGDPVQGKKVARVDKAILEAEEKGTMDNIYKVIDYFDAYADGYDKAMADMREAENARKRNNRGKQA